MSNKNAPEVVKKRKSRPPKLTIRQQRFIDSIPNSKSNTEAAIKAGYSETSAHVTANRLINNDKIQAALIGAAPLAVQVLTNELSNEDAKHRIAAADKILKYTPKTEVSASYDLEDLL